MVCVKRGLNKSSSISLDILLKATLVVLILIGTTVHLLSYIAFAITLALLFFTKNEKCVEYMFFLMPFANINKPSPTSISFFTYLTLLLTLKLLLSKKTIDKRFLLAWIALFCFQVIGCNMQYTLLIKQATILLLVYGCFNCCHIDTKRVVLSLAAGTLVACVAANMTAVFTGISDYMRVVRAYEVSSDLYRFTGLYSDPNYLSQILIVLCVSLFVMIQQKHISARYYALVLLLVFFGTQTISKSFFLMLVVMVLLFVIISLKQNHYGVVIAIATLCASVVLLAAWGKLRIFDYVLERFAFSGDITTGRVSIWLEYLDKLISNPLNLVFGFGIGSSMTHMAHNTYLDYLYYYGIVGSALFFVGLRYAINKKIRFKSIMSLAPVLCAVIMAFFLSNLLMFDFAYILILVMLFFDEKADGDLAEVR